MKVLKNDVLPVRTARNPDDLAARLEGCKRGKIEDLSMASRRRLAIIAANTDVVFRSFVTLTYPRQFPCDGVLIKQHLAAILEALRRFAEKPSYLWFLEFQRRGAPHFHIFISAALPHPLEPLHRKSGRVRKVVMTHRPWMDWLSDRWYRIVGSGDEKHLRAGAAWEVIEKPDGCARYVAKEAYKTFQKVVPTEFQNVGRFWGCSRDVPPKDVDVIPITERAMKALFGDGISGTSGAVYPVLFGASEKYLAIKGSTDDPQKVSQWKRNRRNETAVLPLEISPSSRPDRIEESW